ncbi:glycosyltransferase family 2 protein [Sediminitomix flava]|uniref:Glycosyltransferase involved in cell wall biosynthesis n=1 Tax=Sediminitomix flava TaxID=379075 RepID=A0A315ZHR7_SEDFL|nr:glycosyltransferase family 2 protein [Sediminitomix flava]PWJ44358.1 glycosyltransferase involved in cell wall biosynthesis [Sediminitomix flava]
MKVSLIISTYNSPDSLACVLESIKNQITKPYEVIIADDGSNFETANLIQNFRKQNFTIKHCWQEDKGFRLAKIRNKAIAQAKGDYIIFIDGDIILHPSFIKDHKTWARKNFFLQGSRVLLSEEKSSTVKKEGLTPIHYFSKGIKNRLNTINSTLLAKIFTKKGLSFDKAKGCNMSFWKKDLQKVGGFNEKFIGWGKEDNELAIRLINNSVRGIKLNFAANTYHLYHPMNTNPNIEKNIQLLKETVNRKQNKIG